MVGTRDFWPNYHYSTPSLIRTSLIRTLASPNRRFQKYFSYKSGKNHKYLYITLELNKNKSQAIILGSILNVLFELKIF